MVGVSTDDCLKPDAKVYRSISWINILYGIFFVFVGIPVWWKTTTVYRAWLPYSEIALLKDNPVSIGQHYQIISCDPWTSGSTLNELERFLWKKLADSPDKTSDRVKIIFSASLRECSSQEIEIMRTSTTIDDFEQSLEPVRTFADKDRTLQIVLLPNNTRLLTRGSVGLLKRSGVTFIRVGTQTDQLSTLIHLILTRILVVEKDVIASFNDIYRATKIRPENLRQFRSTASYEVIFNLLNSRPEKVAATWDMTRSLRFFADPFASKIGRYISLSFKSQQMYYVDIPKMPKQMVEMSGTYYREEDLPHLINPIESYLSDSSTSQSSIQFVVYIPPENQHPLYFGLPRSKNETLGGNKIAFISPRWGGLMVYNIEPSTGKAPVHHEVNMRKVMSICIAQLRVLLGVSRTLPFIIPMEEPDDTGVTNWELLSLLRRRTVEQIAVASMTLASLSDLLGKVGNMVIKDNIADEVVRAVNALKIAHQHISEGSIQDAFAASKQALLASERAFFDPSLLELLYFSDDQKYAIYVPLFLPIGLPLLLGVFKGIRFLMKKEKK